VKENTGKLEILPQPNQEQWSPLEEVLRDGARKMLQMVLESEIDEFIKDFQERTGKTASGIIAKNGYHPEREILTGIGKISVKQPRIDDRKAREDSEKPLFTSDILPKYMRKVPSIENLIPTLYLKGISTQDFPSALESILGPSAKGISANVIVRLKEKWEAEYEDWNKRDLSKKKYVYIWADGIYFNVRLADDRPCVLVIIGADQFGNKELIGILDGVRESKESWKDLLLQLKNQGLKADPKLAIADGALGFWAALREVFPGTREQRCWVHKTANILNQLPKKEQPRAKEQVHEMYMAATKKDALIAYHHFIDIYKDKYPKSVKNLKRDFDQLFNFYDFPAAHWRHIRTTNPIESTFATVRLRMRRTKGCANRKTTLSMAFKLVSEAQKRWIKIHGIKFIPKVIEGVQFVDGELPEEMRDAA